MATQATVKSYPKVGEIFELELDGDNPENAPLPGMIKAFGYNPKGWQFTGTSLTGKRKGKFKLVQIGSQHSLDEAKAALEAKYGPTPSGQWMKAFKDAYPKHDGEGPVGIADASWIYPDDDIRVRFPYVHRDGGPSFFWAGSALCVSCRWLVAVPEDEQL